MADELDTSQVPLRLARPSRPQVVINGLTIGSETGCPQGSNKRLTWRRGMDQP